MRVLREWLHRVVGTLSRRRGDQELEQELRLHLQLAAEDAQRQGETPGEAARAAAIRAGGVSQTWTKLRTARPAVADDVRAIAPRVAMLRRSPGFAALPSCALALEWREHGDLQPDQYRRSQNAPCRRSAEPVLRRQFRRQVRRKQRTAVSVFRTAARSQPVPVRHLRFQGNPLQSDDRWHSRRSARPVRVGQLLRYMALAPPCGADGGYDAVVGAGGRRGVAVISHSY